MLDGILVVDYKGQKFAYANRAIIKMLGYSQEEIKKLGVADIHPKEDLPNVLKQFARQAKGEITMAEDLPVKRKDGSVFYVDINAGEIEFDGKKYLMGIFRDITQRKEAESRYRALFNSSSDAIMTISPPNWKFTSGNAAAINLYGVKDEKEFVTLGPWDVSPKYQPDGKLSSNKAKEMIARAMRDGSNFFEWTHKKVRGEDFPSTVLLNRVEINGRPLAQATVRDISAQKRAEKQLEEKLIELERINKLMVGRELKMIELKKEIERLKKNNS